MGLISSCAFCFQIYSWWDTAKTGCYLRVSARWINGYIFIWQMTMYFGKVQICQMSRLSSPQYWRKSETADIKEVITIALDILGPVEPLLTTTLAIHWSIDRMTDRQSKGWFPYIWPWDLKFLSKKICTLKRKILSINHW